MFPLENPVCAPRCRARPQCARQPDDRIAGQLADGKQTGGGLRVREQQQVVLGVAPAAQADPPYANCKAAALDGRYNIPQNDPAYRAPLDRDGDGVACES